MPLINSPSKKAMLENIAKEIQAGRPRGQAVAIAMNKHRRSKAKAAMFRGGEVQQQPPISKDESRAIAKAVLSGSIADPGYQMPVPVKSEDTWYDLDAFSNDEQAAELSESIEAKSLVESIMNQMMFKKIKKRR